MPLRPVSALRAPPSERRCRFGIVSEWDPGTAPGRFADAVADSLDADHLVHRVGLVAPIDPHTHPSVATTRRPSRVVADELARDDVVIFHVDDLDGSDPHGEPEVSDGLLDVIELVHRPTIVVLHRVPAAPTAADRRVLAELCRMADAVVITSAPAAVRLTEVYGVDPSALWLVRADGSSSRRTSTLLTWGVISTGSGIEWMVDAMVHLQGLDLRYIVTGPASEEQSRRQREQYRHSLVQRSWSRGVAARVTFERDDDDQTATTELLAHAAAVIVPTDGARDLPDGFPDEILAAGVPIIATDLAGLDDIRRGGGGLFVPAGDAGALADAVVRIMIDPHLAESLVRRSAELSPATSSLRIGEQFDRIAAALIGSDVRPPSAIPA